LAKTEAWRRAGPHIAQRVVRARALAEELRSRLPRIFGEYEAAVLPVFVSASLTSAMVSHPVAPQVRGSPGERLQPVAPQTVAAAAHERAAAAIEASLPPPDAPVSCAASATTATDSPTRRWRPRRSRVRALPQPDAPMRPAAKRP
jgi:hypothetical protein